MDEDIAEEVLLFILLRRCRRGENVRKSVKSQETFFVKGSNMEKIATSVELKSGGREFYFRYFGCAYILFILAGFLSRTLILVSCQLVAVE